MILLPSWHYIYDWSYYTLYAKFTRCIFIPGFKLLYISLDKNFGDERNLVLNIIRLCKCFKLNSLAQLNIRWEIWEIFHLVYAKLYYLLTHTRYRFLQTLLYQEKKFVTKIEVYVCIFICMTIKTMHLEVEDRLINWWIYCFAAFHCKTRSIKLNVFGQRKKFCRCK